MIILQSSSCSIDFFFRITVALAGVLPWVLSWIGKSSTFDKNLENASSLLVTVLLLPTILLYFVIIHSKLSITSFRSVSFEYPTFLHPFFKISARFYIPIWYFIQAVLLLDFAAQLHTKVISATLPLADRSKENVNFNNKEEINQQQNIKFLKNILLPIIYLILTGLAICTCFYGWEHALHHWISFIWNSVSLCIVLVISLLTDYGVLIPSLFSMPLSLLVLSSPFHSFVSALVWIYVVLDYDRASIRRATSFLISGSKSSLLIILHNLTKGFVCSSLILKKSLGQYNCMKIAKRDEDLIYKPENDLERQPLLENASVSEDNNNYTSQLSPSLFKPVDSSCSGEKHQSKDQSERDISKEMVLFETWILSLAWFASLPYILDTSNTYRSEEDMITTINIAASYWVLLSAIFDFSHRISFFEQRRENYHRECWIDSLYRKAEKPKATNSEYIVSSVDIS